jgi:hypothetical protein
VRRQHALLHAALGRAVNWGMIASNPADRATPPALVLRTVTTPSLADVQRLIAGAEEDMGMSGWPSASTLGGTFTSCGTSERCPGYREPRPEALMTLTRQRRPSWKAPSSSPRRAKSWARSLVIPSIWAASGTETT